MQDALNQQSGGSLQSEPGNGLGAQQQQQLGPQTGGPGDAGVDSEPQAIAPLGEIIDLDSLLSLMYELGVQLFIQLLPLILVTALVWGIVRLGVMVMMGEWRTPADYDDDGELTDEAVDRIYTDAKAEEDSARRRAYVENYMARMQADVEHQLESNEDEDKDK